MSAGLQLTFTNDYTATDTDGIVAQRTVGIEVSDSAIPEIQANLVLGWSRNGWDVAFTTRYMDSVEEFCANAVSQAPVPGCPNSPSLPTDMHTLGATVYNDLSVAWTKAFNVEGLKLALGVNNLFSEDPPICYSCSLNGYDAGTYDLPGIYWAVTARYGF